MSTELRQGTDIADELLRRIGHLVGDRVSVSTVYGEPIEREGLTVVPVARARFGFGGGGGGEIPSLCSRIIRGTSNLGRLDTCD